MPRLDYALQLARLQGMGFPVTADEADDSYRTLGVGRSLPGSHDTKQQSFRHGREGRAGGSRVVDEELSFVTSGANEQEAFG